MADQALFLVPADSLLAARKMSHAAVQWLSRAARANLPPAEDDSHSSLRWQADLAALVSQFLDDEQRIQLGFSFTEGALLWLEAGEPIDRLKLTSEDEAQRWCDDLLSRNALASTSKAQMPYELAPVDYGPLEDEPKALGTLGAWFGTAQQMLDSLIGHYGGMAVFQPTARCWPHHFDLATLFFLDAGDPETARSIGVGLSTRRRQLR